MKNNATQTIQRPISVLREELRQRSLALSGQLSRAVSLETSVDLPCPEYVEEVGKHYRLMNELMWVPHCRATLEVAIARGSARCVMRVDALSREASFRRENNAVMMRVTDKTPRSKPA